MSSGESIDHRYSNEIYKLDLKSWLWSKMSPVGTRPLKSDKMSSWVGDQKMYLFGGYGKPRLSKISTILYSSFLRLVASCMYSGNLEHGTPPHFNSFLNQVFPRQLVGAGGTTSLFTTIRTATPGIGRGDSYHQDA